jgi:hypothetical protein
VLIRYNQNLRLTTSADNEKCIHEHILSIKAHLKVESNLQALLGLSQFYPQVETTKLFPADARPFFTPVALPKIKMAKAGDEYRLLH